MSDERPDNVVAFRQREPEVTAHFACGECGNVWWELAAGTVGDLKLTGLICLDADDGRITSWSGVLVCGRCSAPATTLPGRTAPQERLVVVDEQEAPEGGEVAKLVHHHCSDCATVTYGHDVMEGLRWRFGCCCMDDWLSARSFAELQLAAPPHDPEGHR